MSARDVIANLRALAARTSDAHGAQRVAWGPVWRDARALARRGLLADDGLRAESDVAGNNWITRAGRAPDTVIIGGHLDSVPNGGWLDGALGVLAGRRGTPPVHSGTTPPVTLAVVDFADEEGARFSRSLLGSSGASGSLVPDSVRRPRGPPGHAARRRAGRERRRRGPHARGAPGARSSATRARISSSTSSRGRCSRRWADPRVR